MRITEQTIENAVLQMFAGCGITAGDSLPFRRLRAEWPKTRMRRNDLVQGIKRLIFSGDLELEDDHEGGLFILTPRGYQRTQQLPPLERPGWNDLLVRTLEKLAPRREPNRKERRAPHLPARQH